MAKTVVSQGYSTLLDSDVIMKLPYWIVPIKELVISKQAGDWCRLPAVVTTIGTVEGFPGIKDVMETLKLYGVKKVVLKPFMVVAGDHSMNDMAGDKDDSWKSILVKNGFEVITVIEGLGENDEFANIFVNHAVDAAQDVDIDLK